MKAWRHGVLLLFRDCCMNRITNPISDKELISAACQGSEEAFRMIYDKYWADMYKIAYRRLPHHEDVKDILQDTFISLWRNINHLKDTESLGGYLYISLRNKIFNFFEKNRVRLKKMMNQQFKPVESEEEIYSLLNTKELQYIIKGIVDEMPGKMREIYLLSREEHFTNNEIAALLMLAPQTIKNQVHQALSRIRKDLKKRELHFQG